MVKEATESPRKRQRKTQDEGQIEVKRIRYQNGELAEESDSVETIKCPVFGAVEPARLRVHGSVTRNLQNFNSVRVEVGLELPCLPVLTEIDRVYDLASNFVESKIKAELDSAVVNRGPNGEEKPKITRTEQPGIRRRTVT